MAVLVQPLMLEFKMPQVNIFRIVDGDDWVNPEQCDKLIEKLSQNRYRYGALQL